MSCELSDSLFWVSDGKLEGVAVGASALCSKRAFSEGMFGDILGEYTLENL